MAQRQRVPLTWERSQVRFLPRPPFKIMFNSLNREQLKWLGIGLYLGDGSKYRKNILAFTNGDPELCKIMIGWFRSIYHVNPRKISIYVCVHEPFDSIIVEKFWKSTLGLTEERFCKIRSIVSNRKIRRGILKPMGFCRIAVFDSILAKHIFILCGLRKESDYIDKRLRGHCPHTYPDRTKIKWPNWEDLAIMVKINGYSKVGRNLGVSDNAVKKHLINYQNNIRTPSVMAARQSYKLVTRPPD